MQTVAALPTGNAPPGFAVPPIAPTMPGAPMLVPVPGMTPGLPPPPAGLMTLPGMPGGMLTALPGPPMASGATVSIAIDSLPFRYQLSEADLREMFQRWGAIQSVQVMRDGVREVGAVQFVDQVDAQDAQKQLSGQSVSLDGVTGTLAVVMGAPYQLLAPRPGAPGTAGPVTVPPNIGPGAPKNGGPGLAKGDGKGLPGDGHARPAWCCKIIVEAESLHPEFPTVLRIRGEGDANVEHIRTQTKCNVQLRGTGSGTLEPESNQELPEPMFLWLTSENVENGKASLEMTLDLLKSIYEGHQQWCEQNGILHPEFVKPKVIENPDVPGLPKAPGPATLPQVPRLVR
ncbi:Khdc4 [Symbiodinium natans]|uniref:Khdc4 protein n=1 Tax=Symbiodinium natans TaxID=878477 RepID=A0A812N3C3_9DINO|nr:Khdc4 [Symbiodinium natans]